MKKELSKIKQDYNIKIKKQLKTKKIKTNKK